MPSSLPGLAVVTGASSGIGLELARHCAMQRFDLIIAADDPAIEAVRGQLADGDIDVRALQADLASRDGVDALLALIGKRPVEALLANAGQGLGRAFLDQDLDAAQRVIDTNITGTLALVHAVGRGMRERGRGRILLTGSVAGFMPGTFQAVYNASQAFIDSFAAALRNELKDSGVTVTCLMPGAASGTASSTRISPRSGMSSTPTSPARCG